MTAAPRILGKPLAPIPKQVLTECMITALCESCVVTDIERSPHDQAQTMFNNVRKHGLESQLNLYGPYGDQVLEVYRANALLSPDVIVTLMTKKIEDIGSQKVSHHCATDRYVFDVGPNSVAESRRMPLHDALKNHPKVVKFLSPFTDPIDQAYHCEILKPAT